MRANGALQVLGFLLSLARGSEVGNSQAGKRCGSTGRLGTWDSETNSRGAGGQGQELGLCEAGGAEPRRAGAPWAETVRIRFSAWSGRGRDSRTTTLPRPPPPCRVADPLICLSG